MAFTITDPPSGGRKGRRMSRAGYLLPVLIMAIASAVYGGSAILLGHTTNINTYFDHLAAAMLQGRVDLGDQVGLHDLAPFDGKWYVPFPPLPALLLIPWVALRGTEHTNTVAFSVIVCAVNVALIFQLLTELANRSLGPKRIESRLWISVLFACGCVHWYMSIDGSVYYLGQVCTLAFVALSAIDALRGGPPWRVGLWLAIALWGRPNVILTAPMLAGIAALKLRGDGGAIAWGALSSWTTRLAIPIVISVALLLSHNYARFRDPFEFGYSFQKVEASLAGPLYTYGQFAIEHVPRNAWYLFIAPPEKPPRHPYWVPSEYGMSIFLTTPAVFGLFGLLRRGGGGKPERDYLIACAAAVALSLVPILTYYNTGWQQFGYRFALDFFVPLIMLIAAAANRGFGWIWRGLIVLSVAVNLWGVIWWYTDWFKVPRVDPSEEFSRIGPAAAGSCEIGTEAICQVDV